MAVERVDRPRYASCTVPAPVEISMLWSSPLPPADVAAAMGVGQLLGPITAVAVVSVLTGFAVLLAGMVQDFRHGHRLPLTPAPAQPSGMHHAKASRAA